MGNQLRTAKGSTQAAATMELGIDNPVDVLKEEDPPWHEGDGGTMTEQDIDRQDSRAPLKANEADGDEEDTIVDITPDGGRGDRPEAGEDELVCGVGVCRPRVLQWIAGGPKAFAFWSTLYLLLKTAGTVYIGSVIVHIERQFMLSSVESGAIIILNDALDMGLVIFAAYFGNKTHRPRFMAVGILLAGIGIVLCGVPHFLLQPYARLPEGCNETSVLDYCRADGDGADGEDTCAVDFEQPAFSPVGWLIIGQILLGIGNVPVKPLSTTYIDDAVGKHTTPVYIAFFFIAVSIGPLLGFLFGAGFLSLFVDFDRLPREQWAQMDQSDPRYIGAWWLGFICIGGAVILVSIPFFFFPRFLPKSQERQDEDEKEKASEANEDTGIEMKTTHSKELNGDLGKEVADDSEVKVKGPLHLTFFRAIKDMVMTYKILIMNMALVLLCLSSAMEGANAAALGAFALKYYNVEFGVTGSMASLLAIAVFPFNLVGCLIGGYIIKRRKWSPAKCALFLIFGDVVSIIFVPFFLLMGCQTQAIAGVSTDYIPPPPYDTLPMINQPITLPGSAQQARSLCNMNCTCGYEEYNPVCGSDDITYVSACFAGCEDVHLDVGENNMTTYSSCQCINAASPVNATATDGECAAVCQAWQIPMLIVVSIILIFCSGLGQTGLVLITLRIVKEDMRSAALGFQTVFLNLLGFFPSPIYFGFVINQACILWMYENGERGSCPVYDRDNIRYYFHGLQGSLKLLASIFFLGVYLRLRNSKEKKYEVQSEKTNGQFT